MWQVDLSDLPKERVWISDVHGILWSNFLLLQYIFIEHSGGNSGMVRLLPIQVSPFPSLSTHPPSLAPPRLGAARGASHRRRRVHGQRRRRPEAIAAKGQGE